MSYKENTLKLKKLLFKLKYLYAELDECNYTFDKCKENFSLEFQTKDDFGNPMDDYTRMIYRGQR